MGGRKKSIKFKILTLVLVPLVSLIGIWAFAATVTIQNGLDLLKVKSFFENGIVPTRALMHEIQQELASRTYRLTEVRILDLLIWSLSGAT